MSRKSERLVNLTIALLATKRYLTKAEIFKSIEGYEGSDESKERMFERDKDDLRSLGIDIEVGGFDPLFMDEAGYRIKPETYRLDLGELSGTDIALLSLAAQAWNGQALSEAAHSAIVKLKSIGIDSDVDSIPTLAPRVSSSTAELTSVLDAIATRTPIFFTYLSQDLEKLPRQVQPYAIASKGGHWYFAGFDIEKAAMRTFRLDRVAGEITIGTEAHSFEIPQGFDLLQNFEEDSRSSTAILEVRKDKAFVLRKDAKVLKDLGEWELISVEYSNPNTFIDQVLWHMDDVFVVEPRELQDSIIEILEKLVVLHE